MSSTAFGFIQYLECDTFSEVWLRSWLRRLWQQGLRPGFRFDEQSTEPFTWEEALQTICPYYAGLDSFELPLAQAISHIARQGEGMLTVWDRSIDLHLYVDDHAFIGGANATGAGSPPGFKRILLTINATFFHTPGNRLPPDRETLYEFQQAQLAFLHWSEVLCQETQPLFGISIEPDWRFTIGETQTEYTRDAEVAFARAVQQGEFPTLPPWVSSLYLGARFAPASLIETVNRLPNRWMKRYPDGSLFLFWNPPESYRGFHYMAGEVYRLNALAGLSSPYQLPTQTPDWDEQLRRAFTIYDRAVELARAIGSEAEVHANERAIADLMERAARLKAIAQREEGKRHESES